MIDKIFEFFHDPFGTKKKEEDRELNALIERLDKKSKQVDDALISGDVGRAIRIIESMNI